MSKMKKILAADLKPGMVYSKSVYTDSNTILVGANLPIKESDLKKLQVWGVTEVETAGDLIRIDETLAAAAANTISKNVIESEKKIVGDYNDLIKKRRKLIEIHNQSCKAITEIYDAVKKNKKFETTDVEKSINDIIDILNENYNVFLFLYGLDEGKDYLVTHSVNVTLYSLIIGMALKYSKEKLKNLGLGTILIDAGMLKVPVYIIHKQSKISEQEYNQIKTHPLLGYKSLIDLGGVKEHIANVCLQHHEQFDGKGYPRGLKGHDIDEFARISSIADSYEAQISNRSYRKKVYFYHAMRNLLSSGVNKFDPVILRVFLSMMSVYPIGSIVELNDTSIGIVIGSIPEKPLRPILKIIFDKNGKKNELPVIVNLLLDTTIYIVKALDEAQAGINIFDVL